MIAERMPDNLLLVIAERGARRVAAAARDGGVRVAEWTPTRIRMVTHLDVSAADCERAGAVMRKILSVR